MTVLDSAVTAPTRHARLLAWVDEVAELTRPDRIVWCDGSDAEWLRLIAELVAAGTLLPLDPHVRPNSFLARTDREAADRADGLGRHGTQRDDAVFTRACPDKHWRSHSMMRVSRATSA